MRSSLISSTKKWSKKTRSSKRLRLVSYFQNGNRLKENDNLNELFDIDEETRRKEFDDETIRDGTHYLKVLIANREEALKGSNRELIY